MAAAAAACDDYTVREGRAALADVRRATAAGAAILWATVAGVATAVEAAGDDARGRVAALAADVNLQDFARSNRDGCLDASTQATGAAALGAREVNRQRCHAAWNREGLGSTREIEGLRAGRSAASGLSLSIVCRRRNRTDCEVCTAGTCSDG